jgi:hypothetical protein
MWLACQHRGSFAYRTCNFGLKQWMSRVLAPNVRLAKQELEGNGGRQWLAVLNRHSATRRRAEDPKIRYAHERWNFLRRWKSVVQDDSFYHPALSLDSYHTMLDR